MSNEQAGKQTRSVNFRYIVKDVDMAVAFYVDMLGFHADQHVKSAFASLSLGGAHLFINSPGAGGAGKAMPDGAIPAPGGWNRILITVDNLETTVNELKSKEQLSAMKLWMALAVSKSFCKTLPVTWLNCSNILSNDICAFFAPFDLFCLIKRIEI